MRFEQVQRFILAKKIFWGEGHFKVVKWQNLQGIHYSSLKLTEAYIK